MTLGTVSNWKLLIFENKKPLALQYLLAVDGSFGIDLLPKILRGWSDIENPIHVHTEPSFQLTVCRIHRYFVDKTQAKILQALIFFIK